MLLGNRGYSEAWRLQYLTDLASCRITRKAITTAAARHRRAGERRRHAGLSHAARRAGRRRRATASAGAGRCTQAAEVEPNLTAQVADGLRRLPPQPVRHADDGRLRLVLRPRRADDDRRTRAAPTRSTRWRGRDHRAAGHRHQALQAARRIQLHQDLQGRRRRTNGTGTREALDTLADLRKPPAVRQGRGVLAAAASRLGDPERTRNRSASTRSSATGASSSRS